MTPGDGSAGKPRVLIVDDEEQFTRTLVKRLSARGFDATAVPGGRQALGELDRATYDVVLLDLRMPEMDGVAVLRHLREKAPAVEVIVLTGYASIDSAGDVTRLGVYDYLSKPCDLDLLIERLEAARDHALARRQLMKLQ